MNYIPIAMKMLKNISCFLLLLLLWSCQNHQPELTNYYFDAVSGDNANAGQSAEDAFKTLDQLQKLSIRPGDTIFLSVNGKFESPLELINISGNVENPIVITSYPKTANQKASIHTKGFLNAVLIENSKFVELNNLDISAQTDTTKATEKGKMRCGVLVHTTQVGEFEHIYLSNLNIHDVYFNPKGFTRPKGEVKTANGTQAYGWGIRFINNREGAMLSDVRIENSTIKNVAHTGIKLTSKLKENKYGISDFTINDNLVNETGGPGIQMSGVANGHILNNQVDRSGSKDDSRKWGRGSGLWTWGSSDILIEHNRFTNANGPGDSAGAHIDFNCNNIVLQYNFSANNAGGFCEILGNNYNCAYRYNISVNDGHRVKGDNGAFQEGKIFWLSGYNGNKPQSGPFNSYFYNNTIYVGKDIVPKIAIHKKAKGVLIANNIFHFENPSTIVKGDQYKPSNEEDWQVEDVVFRNNLYLSENTWSKSLSINDQNPFYGNVNFKNQSGFAIEDYTPSNIELIRNQGYPIEKLPQDSIGLIYGLQLKQDILGNLIQDKPDIGAIEVE